MADPGEAFLADYLSRTRSLWEPAAAAGSTGSASRLRAAVQFVHLFCQGFSDKRGSARAAALSYSTLLALVPCWQWPLSVSMISVRGTCGRTDRSVRFSEHSALICRCQPPHSVHSDR